MTSEILIKVIKGVLTVCRRLKIGLVFSGGLAFSVVGRPRTTYDVDGIILVEDVKIEKLLRAFEAAGFKYDKKKPINAVRGLPFITLLQPKFKTYVDLFIAASPFQKEILKRRKIVGLDGLRLPLTSAEDLILLKLLAGRERDMDDVREVILENRGKLDLAYLRKWAKTLGVEVFLEDEMESLGSKI